MAFPINSLYSRNSSLFEQGAIDSFGLDDFVGTYLLNKPSIFGVTLDHHSSFLPDFIRYNRWDRVRKFIMMLRGWVELERGYK